MGKYIIKHYNISSTNYSSADITTATLHFVVKNSNLQTKEELMPCNWRKCHSVTNVQQKMEQIQIESSKSFRIYRLRFVEQILNRVLNENKDVDRVIAAKQCSGRICSNDSCSEPYDTLKRKCDLCGSKVVKKNMPEVVLSNTETLVTSKENSFFTTVVKNDAELKVGEPVMANPNSYDSVKLVLDQLQNYIMTNDRKWSVLGCDGPPYCLASRIIESNPDKYDWVTLNTGLGHLHMNQLKSLFKVLDQIILEPLGKEVLGFCSDKAYSYFSNAKDTHKSYETLRVFLEGTAMEFCSLYVQSNQSVSAQGFLNWCNENNNETFTLVYQLVFNFALAIYVQ